MLFYPPFLYEALEYLDKTAEKEGEDETATVSTEQNKLLIFYVGKLLCHTAIAMCTY